MIHRGLIVLLVFIFNFSSLTSLVYADSLPENATRIIITEIKLGGGNEPKEFVTLYNQSSSAISLEGWLLEYAKPTFDAQNCNASKWSDYQNTAKVALTGSIDPASVISITNLSLTDSLGGSVRIIDSAGLAHDLVGWDKSGVTPSIAPCLDNQSNRTPASWPTAGKSLQRYIDCDLNVPIDTNNNAEDLAIVEVPTPGSLAGPITDDCELDTEPDPGNDPPEDDGGSGGATPEPANSCKGLVLSETLPNPEGSDSGHEFIEIHNSKSTAISLESCQLQTSANTKVFTFGAQEMSPGEYRAFYNNETGLTLSNSSGGSVYLIDADNTELSSVDYPADLGDDVSWSLFDSGWSSTYSITPNAANQLLTDKPCPAGQIRNKETNRCNNITLVAGLTACKPGQLRNPETNRCRNIASLASALKACAPDQYRNPETNRCKKQESTSLKPCKEGQERNPETNRCRNAAGVLSGSDINNVQDVASAGSNAIRSWWLAGFGLLGAALYGLWEWRNEFLLGFMGLKKKLLRV